MANQQSAAVSQKEVRIISLSKSVKNTPHPSPPAVPTLLPARTLPLLNSHLQQTSKLEETTNYKPFDPEAWSMERPSLTQWKQAQVARVSTFFTEPTAGWEASDCWKHLGTPHGPRARWTRSNAPPGRGREKTHAATTQAAIPHEKCDYLFINSHNWGEHH